MDKNSTSSTPATPHSPKNEETGTTASGEPAEVSVNAREEKGEGLAPRIFIGSGASTHPTG